jgi:hypothetical protein
MEKMEDDSKAAEKGETGAFRETFIFAFSPEDAEIFRRFVEVVQDRLLERSAYEESHTLFSYTLAEMLAVQADLRFLARFLADVGSERRLSELTHTEESLSELAARLAPEVAALAARLEREIHDLTADEHGNGDIGKGG